MVSPVNTDPQPPPAGPRTRPGLTDSGLTDRGPAAWRTSGPADRDPDQTMSGWMRRIATSGGQLTRTGTYTVPTPRLTNTVVFSRRSAPAITGNSRAATAPMPGRTTWPPWV